MAVATYTHLQQAILRKTLLAEAEVQDAAGTDPALYQEQLIERAETSTQAALLISQIVYGKVPVDAAKLDSLTAFAQLQFDSYAAMGVARPELGPYEALGRGFASTPEFAAMIAAAGGSDGQFVTNVYIAAFGVGPTQPQVQHFIDQINYFKGIYTAAGIPAASASLQAHGAVLGQIVGEAATQEGSTLDNLAEGFMRAAVKGEEVFDAPIQDSQVQPAPGPGDLPQTLVLTAGIDVIGPTADFPLEQNDTVIGNGQTIQSGDSVDLGGGTGDRANFFLEPTSLLQLLSVYKLTLANVEQVNVTSANSINAAIPLQISADNWTGVGEFWLRDSNLGGTAGVTVDDIQENMVLGFDDYQGNASYQYDNGGLGANATVSVVLEDGSDVNLQTQTQAATDEIGRLNLTITGPGNDIDLDLRTNGGANSSDGLSQMFLSGDGFIAMSEVEFNTLTVLNGSLHAGNWNIQIPTSTAALAAIGGIGNNYLDFNGGFDAADGFNGGDGDDTLETTADTAQLATSANITAVEHLVVTGVLTADRVYTNSAGFLDVDLVNGTTTALNNLRLEGFDKIFIDAQQNGLVQVANADATIIDFSAGGDFEFSTGLDIAEVDNVTLVNNGGHEASLDNLIIDRATPFTDFSTDSLKFVGTGDFEVGTFGGNVVNAIDLVDLSGLTGRFIMGDDFGAGADYLIGGLNNGSIIQLNGIGGAAVSELVFQDTTMGAITVNGFDITSGSGDVIDLAKLGVSSLADISITFDGDGAGFNDDIDITSNAPGATWSIHLENVANINDASAAEIAALIGQVAGRIDFDGVVG